MHIAAALKNLIVVTAELGTLRGLAEAVAHDYPDHTQLMIDSAHRGLAAAELLAEELDGIRHDLEPVEEPQREPES